LGLGSATARLLDYLQAHVGEVTNKHQLRGVAGIGEWARRLRELRVEHGYEIASGMTREDMAPSEYVLESPYPDEQLAADWEEANRIRRMTVSMKERLLTYLLAIYPRSADMERLRHVAQKQSWPRRMRELVEEGWRISSSRMDPDLKPGDYRLDSLEQAAGRSREAIKLRGKILARDSYTCEVCGRSPQGDGVRLEVHHLTWVSGGGTNDPDNLITLCSSCHAVEHAVDHGVTRDELENPDCEKGYRPK
jgi:hypothetical protein